MTADSRRRPRLLAATAMATAPLLALIVARIAWADSLPHTVASHWSGTTTADGFSETATFFWIVLALTTVSAAGAVVAAALAQRRPSALMWLPIATSLSATAAATWIVSVITTKSAGDPHEAVLGWWIALPLLAAGWGLAIFAVLPRAAAADATEPVPTLARPLQQGERAVWFGRVRSTWAAWLAGALLIGAVATALLTEVWPALILLLTAFVVGALATVTVRVDHTGLSLQSWGLRWKRVPLEKIASARVETLRPMEWGGWGYRVTGRGSALISHGGDGLVLSLDNRRAFAVTVEDPDGAARLLNSLLVRQS
ncbi:hypothetical protein [Tomitella biformata]|uniref:hypothetical protein n=1 Tax=Tomitella biformata TaxID=630403 RepID=UPI000462FF7A|nr:hypothetical protein [Tomitella biformata]